MPFTTKEDLGLGLVVPRKGLTGKMETLRNLPPWRALPGGFRFNLTAPVTTSVDLPQGELLRRFQAVEAGQPFGAFPAPRTGRGGSESLSLEFNSFLTGAVTEGSLQAAQAARLTASDDDQGVWNDTERSVFLTLHFSRATPTIEMPSDPARLEMIKALLSVLQPTVAWITEQPELDHHAAGPRQRLASRLVQSPLLVLDAAHPGCRLVVADLEANQDQLYEFVHLTDTLVWIQDGRGVGNERPYLIDYRSDAPGQIWPQMTLFEDPALRRLWEARHDQHVRVAGHLLRGFEPEAPGG